ncbi:MAG: glycoside hydrolase family 3 N-terminal domain-containing protein [Bacilli bacterium]|nr:glycoside hydrolase family 3 N-terminal domain-containing protein [Bacilli bacterium]
MKKEKSVAYSIIILLCIMLTGINAVLFSYTDKVSQAIYGNGINYDNEGAEASRLKGSELACSIAESGITLLKNDGTSLPLKNDRVNVFGWGGSEDGFLYQGGGSGAGSLYAQTSLYAGLAQNGISVNPTLMKSYSDLNFHRPGYSEDISLSYRLYEPGKEFYTADRMQQAQSFSDVALVVLSRKGLEGTDVPKVQFDDRGNVIEDRKYCGISELEEVMIKNVTSYFSKVIVILNNANVMECPFLLNSKINACLAIYMPGNFGTLALAKILKGEISPSGRTVDTWAYDVASNPTYPTTGINGAMNYADAKSIYYQDYLEDIYVGYRYYETADATGEFDQINNEIGKGYDGVVQFPFGYGLSYTTFDWKITDVNYVDGSFVEPSDKISVKVQVVNTGETYSGSDVVELYCSPPYKKGEIEKSSIVLCAFAKTTNLQPHQGEELTLTFNMSDLASYDCFDRNNNGYMGYELEEGNYSFSLRTDAHHIKQKKDQNSTFELKVKPKGFLINKDATTGYQVSNRFTTFTNPISHVSSIIDERATYKAYSIDGMELTDDIRYLSRANFTDTETRLTTQRAIRGELFDNTWVNHEPNINESDLMPTMGSTKTHYTLNDLVDKDYDSPMWNDMIEQLDASTIIKLVANGGFGTNRIESINKPSTVDTDGPCGFATYKATNYPCETLLASTWDWKLAYQMGEAVADEANAIDVDGWYAPGANIHRSPLGGRNFEYYSEDPLLSGIICASEVKGATNNGLYCYIKHFVCNDTDTGRNGEYKFLTEQALREIYLKPFEIAVKFGNANAIMSSVDRIGTTRCSSSYALLTEVLRNEWGFKGSVITDSYQGGNVHNPDECIRAGNDLLLTQADTADAFKDLDSATALIAFQKAAKNTLYTYVNTKYLEAKENDISFASITFHKDEIYPYWIPILIAVDFISYSGLIAWTLIVRKRKY